MCDTRKIRTVKSTFILICILDDNKCWYCIHLQSTIKAHCLSHSHKPTWRITAQHLTFWEMRIWKKKYKRFCYSKYLSVLKRQIFLWSLLNEFKSYFLIWNCLRVDIKCVLQYCMIMWVFILYILYIYFICKQSLPLNILMEKLLSHFWEEWWIPASDVNNYTTIKKTRLHDQMFMAIKIQQI